MAAGNSPGIFGFDPRSVPGCRLWLDALDSSTLTGTSPVTAWRDKSISVNNATGVGSPSISASINGRNAMYFNGSSYFTGSISSGSTTQLTIFMVAQLISPFATFAGLLCFGNPSQVDYDNDGSLPITMYIDQSAIYGARNSSSQQTPISAGVPFMYVLQYDGAAINSWKDGTIQTNPQISVPKTGTFTYTNYAVAARAGSIVGQLPWTGYIGEILVYQSPLSITERQRVQGYLAQKWGTTIPNIDLFSLLIPRARTFQPVDVPGCAVWLDGGDRSTMTFSGSNITTWNDKSGNGRFVTSLGTITYNDTQRAVQLDGAGNSFFEGIITTTPIANPTYVIVSRQSSGNGPLFTRRVSEYGYFPNAGGTTFLQNDGGGWTTIASPVANGTDYIHSIVYSPSNVSLWVSGSNAINNAARNAFTTFSIDIGARRASPYSERMTGFIYEFIVFNTTLTTSQRQQLEGYLAWKWNLRSSLPSTHPFFRFPSSSALPFSARGVPGCQLWLDAADMTTVTGTNPVTVWADKSGNGRNLSVGSGTTTYVSNSIRLNTSYMLVTSAVNLRNASFFIVSMSPNSVNNQTVFGARPNTVSVFSSVDGFGFYIDAGASQIRYYGTTTAGQNITNTSITTSTPFLSSFTAEATGALSSWHNGTTRGTGTTGARTSTAQGFSIGGEWQGASYANIVSSAYIYEVIVYNLLLTTTQRQQVEGYLAWKWGLQTSLPSSHPYYRFTPVTTVVPSIVPNGLILDLNANTYVSGTTWVPSIGTNWALVNSPTVSSGLTIDSTSVLTTNGSTSYIYDPTGVIFTGAFSIDIWVYIPTPSTTGNILIETNGGYQWTDMYVSNSTFYGATYTLGGQSLGTCTANTWTNLCITNSASGTSTYTGYSNGARQSTTSYNRAPPSPNSFFYLGAPGGNPNFGYKALSVGAIKFYNIALTATQVKQNYDALSSRFIQNP